MSSQRNDSVYGWLVPVVLFFSVVVNVIYLIPTKHANCNVLKLLKQLCLSTVQPWTKLLRQVLFTNLIENCNNSALSILHCTSPSPPPPPPNQCFTVWQIVIRDSHGPVNIAFLQLFAYLRHQPPKKVSYFFNVVEIFACSDKSLWDFSFQNNQRKLITDKFCHACQWGHVILKCVLVALTFQEILPLLVLFLSK